MTSTIALLDDTGTHSDQCIDYIYSIGKSPSPTLPGHFLLDSIYGKLQMHVNTDSITDELQVHAKITFAPRSGVTPDFLRVSMLTLPNKYSRVICTSPNTRVELGGKRDILNCSSEHLADWELRYNHTSVKYTTWDLEATFHLQHVRLVEICPVITVKKSAIAKLFGALNTFHWEPQTVAF